VVAGTESSPRDQARVALGSNTDQGGLFDVLPKKRSAPHAPPPSPPAKPQPSEAIGVLTLGEAATRLRVSSLELEAMIDAGTIRALPTGYARMIPTREVERLAKTT
jgi:excisionase family DNA binding protein